MAMIDTVDDDDKRLEGCHVLLPQVLICFETSKSCITVPF
jgi:hypothetical protein